MKVRSTPVVAAVVAIVAGTGIAAAVTMGGTAATLSDTRASTPSVVGAASVVLGREGGALDLGYDGLVPGTPQRVDLRIDYRGTVAADVSLAVAPDGGSGFCESSGGSWEPRPGVPLTMTVGDAAPVSYCSLHGTRIPLGSVRPGTTVIVPVVVELGADATTESADLRASDAVVVHADGGFTDSTPGTLTVATAPATPEAPDLPVQEAAPLDVSVVAVTDDVPAVALDPADPATSAREAPAGTGITLPDECADAGMTPEAVTRVVALAPSDPVWDGSREPGPVLVLGTAEADAVTGSASGDCIVGGAGDDTLSGGTGDDVLVGDVGEDLLTGAAGADLLFGGAGLDDLRGGDGRDSYDGEADDAICDATAAETALRCLPADVPEPSPVAPAPPAATTGPAPVPADPAPVDTPPADPAPAGPTAPDPSVADSTSAAVAAPATTRASDEVVPTPDSDARHSRTAADPTSVATATAAS